MLRVRGSLLLLAGLLTLGALMLAACGSSGDGTATDRLERADEGIAEERAEEEARAEAEQRREERRQREEGERAAEEEAEATASCHPSYEGACLDPSASDYDCAGGSGDGPLYTGTVYVVGPDDFGLDRDGDGVACEA